jgi:rod shape-determining protein MreC
MRQLLQLFLRFGGLFLFLLLEGLCFYLIVNFNQRQKQIYLSSASDLVGGFYERYENTIDYLNLKDQIKNLMEENARLRRQLPNASYINNEETDTIQIIKEDTLIQRYEYIPAKVINNSIISTNNLLTLNKGREEGVEPHMGVIGREGIVGIIRNVGDHYSSVMSILHSQTRISAAIRPSGYFGSLVWKTSRNPQFMQLEAIPKHAKIEVGDTVQTSGYSIFPEGIIIGLVEERTIEPGNNFYNIKVKLTNDLAKIKHTYIVRDLEIDDIEQLKESVENE